MNVLDARLCLLLHNLAGLSDLQLSRLFLRYGSADKIWESHPGDWRSLGVTTDVVSQVKSLRARGFSGTGPSVVGRQLDVLQGLGAEVISLVDDRYPRLLQTLYDPPPILYVRGQAEVLQQAQLGIVGSRRASPPGLRAAWELSAGCVRSGLHICSGLALGIDRAAHCGALESGGKTIAVMATGLDVIYPARNRCLADELLHSGCLVSEFPPGAQPLRARFPQRNRIISGLSLGVLVVEAALRSGSLITARMALEQGREVFTLPWSIFHPAGKGCLGLIRDGAKMVQGVEDVIEELGPLYQCQWELQSSGIVTEPAIEAGSEYEAKVLCLIGSDVISVDEIVLHSGLGVDRVLAALSILEMQRQIVRSDGGYIHC